ncbi:MAG: YbaY family lipoprotein [Candidatus Sumerlaeia bacterium]|nr:YbaY family lipoprotein [Candidatus Sumerlaeia bacterium]
MTKLLAAATLAALLGASCAKKEAGSHFNAEPSSPEAGTKAAETAGKLLAVEGTVYYLERIMMSPDTVLDVRLYDASDPASEESVEVGVHSAAVGENAPPYYFAVYVDEAKVDPTRQYILVARLVEDGRDRFVSEDNYLILTPGYPSETNLLLSAPEPKE